GRCNRCYRWTPAWESRPRSWRRRCVKGAGTTGWSTCAALRAWSPAPWTRCCSTGTRASRFGSNRTTAPPTRRCRRGLERERERTMYEGRRRPLTANEIRTLRIRRVGLRKGYDPHEVDDLLTRLAEETA